MGSPSPPPARPGLADPCAGTNDWSWLPADLLSAVFKRLPSDADRVRVGAVCTRWGAAAAAWRPRPWLVGSRADDRSGRSVAMSSFWLSQGDDGLVQFAAAVPDGSEYLSSSHGYLALANPRASTKTITLFNPVTCRRISLPPIAFFKKWHDVTTIVLSADPDAADEWSAVAIAFPTNCLAYYSSATGAWTPLRFNAAGYPGVEHYNGRFYVAFESQLCVCELDVATPAVIPLEQFDSDSDYSDDEAGALAAMELKQANRYEHSWDDEKLPGKRVVETHLVECDGELLIVSVYGDVRYNSESTRTGSGGGAICDERTVEVHRVEWMEDGRVQLEKEEDLGDNALFLGRNHAFALSAEKFPACQPNCVYLVDLQGHPDGLVRVVDLDCYGQSTRRDENIYPVDGKQGSPSAGWARRGWFIPKY
ncbi:hypothetical protein ABZP36_012849 [Zizania latifolia]